MTGPDDDRKRLDALARDLEELRKRRREKRKPRENPHAAASHLVMRLLTDLAAGLIAGVLLGWGIDRWLNTAPWGIVVGSLLGLAAGVRNVLRTADTVSGERPPTPPPET
jgi:ATP synthase protein I